MEEKKKAPEPAALSDAEVLVKIELTAARLEEANRKNAVLLAKMEEARVSAMLGGSAEAGVEPTPVSAEEKLKKDIQSWMPKQLLPISLR